MSTVNHYSHSPAREPELSRRIVEATIAVVTQYGYERATMQLIAERAGANPTEVDRRFGDKERCCLLAFDEVCEQVDCLLLPIYLRPEPWRERIPAAAFAAARYCGEHEDRVRFAIEERFRRGRLSIGESSLRLHLQQVDAIRHETAEPERIPTAAAELAVGAFLEALLAHHAEGALGSFKEAVPGLLYNAFRLFLSPDAAAEVLRRGVG